MYIRVPYEEAKYTTGAVLIRRVARCMFLPTCWQYQRASSDVSQAHTSTASDP